MSPIYRLKLDFASEEYLVFSPFLAAAAGGGLGCADVVLPVDGAVLTLETVLAVAAVESLVVAVGDLDVADVGLEVERPGEGLQAEKNNEG